MDFFKTKQPIALPLDPEDEKLLKASEESDPELAVNAPQQQERSKRCCFTRCRKIRLVGHFLLLGAFLHWFWRPTVRFYNGTFDMPEVQFSDFTDLDEIPITVPSDFLWAGFDSHEKLECDKYAHWSEPKEIEHPCPHRHGRHRPGGPEPPYPPYHPNHPDKPDQPHEPDHPHEPGPPHEPGHPHGPDHPGGPDHPHKPHHPHKPDHPGKPHHPHKPGHPHRPGGRPRGPKYASDASFKLPLSDLLFYSHGPFAYGGIKFHQDDSDSLRSDEVEVTINAKIWDKAALELAKVCTLKRKHGAGLGIWTERVEHEDPEERKKHELAMGISVKFPKHPDTLEIEKLRTHMPLFAHLFEKADIKVKNLVAATLFLPIKAEALTVDRGHIRTENNAIVGNFTATELLVLETRNSPIAVNVTLKNDPIKHFSGDEDEEDDFAAFSKLFIKTSNSPVHGNITLFSDTKDHSGGKFLVDTFTSNSPLHVGFADAPVDSTLRFLGLTSNSPAVAVMHPTFQGDFLVKSTLFGPKIDITQDVKDPKGKNRTRTVDVSKVGRQIVGKVYWGSEDESKDVFGHAELGSTLLSATLKL